ncbi:uncharacterized protein CTRU02_207116 [Colletotrichum truncatum]|uniref:Uncharacterized protein n=1 Tax=Colletotrichum truncatum TaxID=5467 RepID=A0ACC3YZY2_COLTU|nr:uncharacterized protein CTRU02_01256 [Colletotrichum truncatum]KAF6800851.1 hypothetical protein CTRU02_01256 [Colletotrichum truncatum]
MKTVIIAVIGPSGAGKTAFIKSLTKSAPINPTAKPVISDPTQDPFGTDGPLSSNVSKIAMYRYAPSNCKRPLIFVDTPSITIDKGPDIETIRSIQTQLEGRNHKLSGVIYLQRIIDSDQTQNAIRNLRAFCEIFNPEIFRQIVVATTFWDAVSKRVGECREAECLAEVLDCMGFAEKQGIKIETARLHNTVNSSIALMKIFRQNHKSDEHEDMEDSDAVSEFFQLVERQVANVPYSRKWYVSNVLKRGEWEEDNAWDVASQESDMETAADGKDLQQNFPSTKMELYCRNCKCFVM